MSDRFLMAGEIIIAPQQNETKSPAASGASENRQRAQSYRKKKTSPTIIIVPEDQVEEEGVLSPRGGSAPPDNRSKAKEYLRDPDTGKTTIILVEPDQATEGKGTNQENLERNRNKARRYSDGDTAGAEGAGKNTGKAATYLRDQAATGVVGPDGVLVVVCGDANNASGFIGEAMAPGSVFTIMINGRAVKARCR